MPGPSGEPLDIEQPDALLAYLRETERIAPDETPRIEALRGGVSNRTVLVERPTGEAWVLKQALAKLRVRVDWFSDPARIEREALGLRWLERLAPPGAITPLVFDDRERHLLAMRAVPRPHENLKALLLAGTLERGMMLDYAGRFGAMLGTIQRQALGRAGELATIFEERRYFESLRVEPYYLYTAAQAPEAADFLHALVDETRRRRVTLVHGDYSPKNVLVRQGRLVLLDHEVIHWGDAAFDAGFALAHLLSKAHHVRTRRRDLLDAAVVFEQAWTDAAGADVADGPMRAAAVRHALGCLLARVAGRSTLEYLPDEARQRQRRAAVKLMASPPPDAAGLAEGFAEQLRGMPEA